MRSRAAVAGSIAAVAALVIGACSPGVDDSAEPEQSTTSEAGTKTSESSGDAAGSEGAAFPQVQHMWLYQRVGTIDADGAQVDLTDGIIDHLDDEPSIVELGDGVIFEHHEALGARLVGIDGEVRPDVTVIAGVLKAGDEQPLAVIATPDAAATEPIGLDDDVQLDLTFLGDDLAPGDPLFMDVAFVQGYGDGSDEDGLDGAELLAARLAAGQANIVGVSSENGSDGPTMLAFSPEIGSAVEGSTWSSMSAMGDGLTDRFGDLFGSCTSALDCVDNYFDGMIDVVKDFSDMLDCTLAPGNCGEPPPPTTTTTTQRPTTTSNNKVDHNIPVKGGSVNGDPHVATFDGRSYDMQAVGEFVAARSDDLEVQIRTKAIEGSPEVSLLSGVAIGVDGHELSIVADGIHLDGELLDDAALEGPVEVGDAELAPLARGYELRTSADVSIVTSNIRGSGMSLQVEMPKDDTTGYVGLLGDNDGDVDNDLAARDGTVLDEPDFDEFYDTFANSWRLSDDESLFAYNDGESTDTYTDLSLPTKEVSLDTIPATDRARAKAVCEAAGVVETTVLDDCILDYAVTGEIGFVRSARTADTAAGVWSGRLVPDGSDAAAGPGPDDGHGPDDPESDETGPIGDVRTHEAPWAETASSIREDDEEFTRVQCPANGEAHTVWGTDTYTDDSSVCTAAVHIGIFGFDDGGEVLIEHRPGLGSYRGTDRNDVSTRDWDSWPGTFVFINARGVAVEGD